MTDARQSVETMNGVADSEYKLLIRSINCHASLRATSFSMTITVSYLDSATPDESMVYLTPLVGCLGPGAFLS